MYHLAQLLNVQAAMYFRAVSVASDEPLCLATLMALDPAAVTSVACRQERMAIVWNLIAKQCGGIPARVIFFAEQPLQLATLDGWRWAPKTLLIADFETGLDYDIAINRFTTSESGRVDLSVYNLGSLSEQGLRVTFPGSLLTLKPWTEGSSKWPWSLLHSQPVEQLFCRDKSTGKWFTIVDYFLSRRRIRSSSSEERAKRDKQMIEEEGTETREGKRRSQPIFNELCSGNVALIKDTMMPDYTTRWLLVRLRDEYDENAPLHVHASLTVLLTEVDPCVWPALDALRTIAAKVAGSEENQQFLCYLEQAGGGDHDNDECRRIVKELAEEMQRQISDYWDESVEFAASCEMYLGKNRRDRCLRFLLSAAPYDLCLEPLSDDRVWVVDRPVAGDGKCKEECCETETRDQDF